MYSSAQRNLGCDSFSTFTCLKVFSNISNILAKMAKLASAEALALTPGWGSLSLISSVAFFIRLLLSTLSRRHPLVNF